MSWYNEAIFYHIYPLGLTGAPKQNEYTEPVHRLNTLLPWIDHIKEIGCTALYIGPLFESVGHGYETTDYKKLDSRLGTNEDLTAFVKACHDKKIKVIFDGVFNHTGRDFFAFKDIQQNRENSRYLNWYCNVNFWGFGIEGRKERSSDDSLRPALNLEDYESALSDNPFTALIAALGKIRQNTPALSYGSYTELQLTNRQFAFARDLDSVRVIVTVNNDDNDAWMNLPAGNAVEYIGTLTGQKVSVEGGHINVRVGANSGEIWIPSEETSVPETFSENKDSIVEETPVTQEEVKNEGSAETKTASASSVPEAASTKEDTDRTPASTEKEPVNFDPNKAPEDMSIEELQAGILAKMANNGPVTDQMKKTVYDNIWHDSLVNWLKSFC